jgi:transposase
LAQYAEVQRLHAEGLNQRAIAAKVGLHRVTVATFIHADTFPERQERPPQPSILDPYKPYLHQHLDAGCRTGMDLFREIQTQGYTGSQTSVLGYLAQYRREQGLPPRKQTSSLHATPRRRVSVRQAVGLILRRADTLDADERQQRECIKQASPIVTQASALAQAFAQLGRQHAGERLDAWLDDATRSDIAPLMRFATGICETDAEVRAALDLSWSNGVVEGQINRLKTIRRSMYGRGKLDLLRQRMLAT